MEETKRTIKVKNIEFLPDSIVCEIEPISGGIHVINYFNIHKKDVSPEKYVLVGKETKLPFHTKKHLPEYYNNYKSKNEKGFVLFNYDKKTFSIGEVIGEAFPLVLPQG